MAREENNIEVGIANSNISPDISHNTLISPITMPAAAADSREYQDIFHWAETQKDGQIPSFGTRKNDPYEVWDPDQSTLEAQMD